MFLLRRRPKSKFRVGDKVRVKADAKMIAGSYGGPPSTHAGQLATVVSVGERFPNDYPVRIAFTERDRWGCGFNVEELEAV
jgi:hypothetical protein